MLGIDTTSDHTEHNTLLHSKNTDVKHEMKRKQRTKQQSGRTQLWGSWLPTRRSAGTPPAPAGTVGPGIWAAHRGPRPPSGPGQTEPHGDASDPPDPSRPPCTPTFHRSSQGARKAESWTRWRSGRHSSGEHWLVTAETQHKHLKKKKDVTHISYDPTGPDAVIVSHPALVFRVLSPSQNVLVAQVVGPLIQDPGAALHSNRVAAAEVGVELGTVAVALKMLPLKVFVYVEHNLQVHRRDRDVLH